MKNLFRDFGCHNFNLSAKNYSLRRRVSDWIASVFACMVLAASAEDHAAAERHYAPPANPPTITVPPTRQLSTESQPSRSEPTECSIGAPTDIEQLAVELINRARADAEVEATRLSTIDHSDILNAYEFFDIYLDEFVEEMQDLPSSLPPLAINAELMAVAAARSWIARSPVFDEPPATRGEQDRTFQVKTVRRIEPCADGMAFYAVALRPTGYVITTVDRRLPPVVAYSGSSALDLEEPAGNALRAMLTAYSRSAHKLLRDNAERSGTTSQEERDAWEHLLIGNGQRGDAPGEIVVEPLLTTNWNQNNHYNELCPPDPDASAYYDGRVPTGCVPVAFAQVMKFHNWPVRGTGSHEYADPEPIGGTRSARFADPYDWERMKTSYDPWDEEPEAEVHAVAELLYELGVAAEIDYRDDGSSASKRQLMRALREHFYYEGGEALRRSDDPDAFDSAIEDDLLAGQPVPVSVPGHAIVADGLGREAGQDYYHINYGWGGTNDGWYIVTDVVGAGLDEAIVNIQPQRTPLLSGEWERVEDESRFTLDWRVADSRTEDIGGFRVQEGVRVSQPYECTCDSLAEWRAGEWQVESAAGDTFFRLVSGGVSGSIKSLAAKDPFFPGEDSTLSFRYKAELSTDVLRVEVSANAGDTYSTVFSVSDVLHNTWREATVDLSEYAGQSIWLRFAYETGRYYRDGGIWLDNISCQGSESLSWTTVADDLAPSSRSCEISDKFRGTYYYRVGTDDGSDLSEVQAVEVDIPNVYYTVAFELGSYGTRSGGGELEQNIEHGESATAPTIEPDEGWQHTGWNADFAAVTENLTVTAQYERITHTLTVESEHGTPDPAAGGHTHDWGTELSCSVTSPDVQGGTRYVCIGWTGTGSVPATGDAADTGSFTLTEDSSITWTWDTEHYLDTGISGKGSVDIGNEWHTAGTNVTVTATPAAHHHFTGWSGDTDGCIIEDATITAPMTQARTLTATFAIDTYTVTFDLADHGTLADGDLVQTIARGAAAEAPQISPDQGWWFAGWGTDFDNVTEDLTVTAHYAEVGESILTRRGVNLCGAEFGQYNLPGTYGTDYIYPDTDTIRYFLAKGMTTIRLTFRWERLQRTLGGELDATELARMHATVETITDAGGTVILDPHAHNTTGYHDQILGTGEVTEDAFADFWSRLAAEFADNDRVAFGLINEPHDIQAATWLSAANAAIAGIRDTGATNLILVPGINWTSSFSWYDDHGYGSNAETMTGIVDSQDNFAVEVHLYFDEDNSGTTSDVVSPTIGREHLADFVYWCRTHDMRGFLGEVGAPATDEGDAVLDDTLNYIETEADDVFFGWTYWAAGQWWPEDERFSIQPADPTDFDQEDQQLTVMSPYLPSIHRVEFSAGTHGSLADAALAWQVVPDGQDAEAPPVTANDGWRFTAWNADFAGVTDDLTVTAQYERITHTLTVASPHGTPAPAVGEHTHDWGTELTCSVSSPDVQGSTRYVCTGWNGAGSTPVTGDTTDTRSFTLTDDSSITWNWRTEHHLDTEVAGEGGVDVNDSWHSEGDEVTITATPDEGREFVEWTGATEGCTLDGRTITVPMDRPRMITASFLLDTRTLTYTASENGRIDGPNPQTVEYGENGQPVEVAPETGYHFVQWSDGVTDNPRTDTGVTGTVDVTAEFAINEYTVIFQPGDHGELDTGDPTVEVVVEHGEPAPTLPTVVNVENGWVFEGWDPELPDTITEDFTTTAAYASELNWEFTINVDGVTPDSLSFGMSSGATGGVDDGIDETMTMPAADQAGSYLYRTTPDQAYRTDIIETAGSGEWFLVVQAGADNPVELSWSAARSSDFPDGKYLTMYEVDADHLPVGATARNMMATQHRSIDAGETAFFVIRYADTLVADIVLREAWNLISLPIEPETPQVSDLFYDVNGVTGSPRGTALRDGMRGKIYSGEIWTYTDGDYQAVTELAPLVGYWVYAESAAAFLLEGQPVVGEELPLSSGWNLRGPAASVAVPDNPHLRGSAWWWDADSQTYQTAEELLPCRGYWLNARQETTLFSTEEER